MGIFNVIIEINKQKKIKFIVTTNFVNKSYCRAKKIAGSDIITGSYCSYFYWYAISVYILKIVQVCPVGQ